jgi:hypothetical protein
MRCDASHLDLPTAQMQEKQDERRHEPTQRPDLGGEEVGRHEDIHVRADELLPCGRCLALRRWSETVVLQDVTHGLGTGADAQ